MKILIISNQSWNIYNFRYNLCLKFVEKKFNLHILAKKDYTTKYFKSLKLNFNNLYIKERSTNPFYELMTFLNILIKIVIIRPKFIFFIYY